MSFIFWTAKGQSKTIKNNAKLRKIYSNHHCLLQRPDPRPFRIYNTTIKLLNSIHLAVSVDNTIYCTKSIGT